VHFDGLYYTVILQCTVQKNEIHQMFWPCHNSCTYLAESGKVCIVTPTPHHFKKISLVKIRLCHRKKDKHDKAANFFLQKNLHVTSVQAPTIIRLINHRIQMCHRYKKWNAYRQRKVASFIQTIIYCEWHRAMLNCTLSKYCMTN
jgi:hypothetical protein